MALCNEATLGDKKIYRQGRIDTLMAMSQLFPPPAFAWAVALSLLVCFGIVITKDWHGHLTLDGSDGVQKFHTAPTPRVGGIGIMTGLVAAWLATSTDVQWLLKTLVVAGLPAFVFGTAEDLTKRVSVRARLLATMASGVLAWWLTGIYIARADIWGFDALLSWLPFAVAFTAFCVGGVANAFNIIDGFNGLASGVAMVCFGAFAWIAFGVGDFALAKTCLLLIGVTLGFWLCNFPFGKIFLGDGGAYLLGFILCWVSILLPMRNESVSPWASALILGYPVLEVLFSILRRMRRKLHPGHPDRLHLHSLIKSRVTSKLLGHWPAVLVNAAVSPVVWILATVPAVLGVLYHNNPTLLAIAWLGCAAGYAIIYRRLVLYRWF